RRIATDGPTELAADPVDGGEHHVGRRISPERRAPPGRIIEARRAAIGAVPAHRPRVSTSGPTRANAAPLASSRTAHARCRWHAWQPWFEALARTASQRARARRPAPATPSPSAILLLVSMTYSLGSPAAFAFAVMRAPTPMPASLSNR